MEKYDYLFQAIKLGLPLKLEFMKGIFTVSSGNKYIRIKDGTFNCRLDKEYFSVKGDIDEPLFQHTDDITVPAGTLPQIKGEIKTTVGRLLLNYLLGTYALDGELEYIDEQFSFSKIEKEYLLPRLRETEKYPKIISQYKRIAKTVLFIRSLVDYIVIVSTEDTMYPPEGLMEYKSKLLSEYETKYGKEFYKNDILILEIEEKLLDYVKEKLKDDPTIGITTTSKTINSSFKKKYISIGLHTKMSEDEENTNILTSLYDSYPDDKKQLAAIFNGIRYGSYGRALETRGTGVMAKQLVRSTHGFKITSRDCGTTGTYTIKVTDNNLESLLDTYIKDGSGFSLKDRKWLESKKGSTVDIRTPLYCKSKGDTICKICAGRILSKSENGLGILAITIGGYGLSHSLSKFHGVSHNIQRVNKDSLLGKKN